ncbi:hypothetical protein BCR37DRAFT_384540 [Protomyces lactucae-debilis]|uniref:Uncharacterized protein n=1 Tax=Protomyces lactucae-debilis TaxID=2754530 RepID=A0A1Y2ERF8_PROLT|nr:uncharacterized protein BCR37DRAFT_384540 [Protomyces lactucae-debilis]ORY74112.1 hypothetical protein BCR37DRAFT_384540 [Protomyces lactucae-debilis]
MRCCDMHRQEHCHRPARTAAVPGRALSACFDVLPCCGHLASHARAAATHKPRIHIRRRHPAPRLPQPRPPHPKDIQDTMTNKAEIQTTTCNCMGDESICACKTGQCVCSSCPKSARKACNCGGDVSACECDGGACSCSNCPKSSK